MEPERPTLVADAEVPGAYFVRCGGTDQSFVDPADPLRLEFDYVQRVADVIDTVAAPGQRIRVVHVGGGGLTLARYISATRPTSAQVVLEPDEQLTSQVRELLPLPRHSGIKVRGIDGRRGLAEISDGSADLVIVDAFAGAQVPPELSTLEWFGDVRRVTGAMGAIVMNLTDGPPLGYAKRVLAGIRENFDPVAVVVEPATLKGRRFGNLVVSGGGIRLDELSQRAGRAVFTTQVVTGSALDRWIGGAAPFTESDAAPSPPPPGGPLTFR